MKVNHRALLISLTCALVLLGSACWAGIASEIQLPAHTTHGPGADRETFWTTFAFIAAANIRAWCTLIAGAVTFGVVTFIAAVGVGLYLGTSIGISLEAMGLTAVVQSTWLYTPFEFLGLVCACAAGIYPTIQMLLVGNPGQTTFFSRWRASVENSLPLILVSFAFICTGIVVETFMVSL